MLIMDSEGEKKGKMKLIWVRNCLFDTVIQHHLVGFHLDLRAQQNY